MALLIQGVCLLTIKRLAEFSVAWYTFGMMLCYFGLPISVILGGPIVMYTRHEQLRSLLCFALMGFLAQSLHGFLESWTADFNIYAWHEPSHLWHAPHYITPVLRRWFSGPAEFVLGKVAALQPAGSVANRSSEDDHSSAWERIKVLMAECQMMPHILVLCSCVAGASLCISRISNPQDASDTWIYWVTHVGWPPALFFWTFDFTNALLPFKFACFVSPRARRDDHLTRDAKSSIAYPTTLSKDQKHRRVIEWHLCLAIAYTVGVAPSFWRTRA